LHPRRRISLPLDSSGSSPFITRPERGLYGNGMSCPGESDPIFIPGGEQQRGGLRACQARLADFAGDEGLTSIEGA
jgi:hypothetical protein